MVRIMPTKKKIKLKKKFKKLILIILLCILFVFLGFKIKNNLEFKKTLEYELQIKGYEPETVELIKNKLSKEHIDYLKNQEKIDYIKEIISEKYYLDKNFDEYLKYYQENSKKSFEDVVTLVNIHATGNFYENAQTTDTSLNEAMLVNKFNILPDDFNPGNIKKFSKTYAYGEVSAEENCYNAFITMAKSAKEEGITLILTSGYRSSEKQKSIYDDMKKRKGQEYADKYAARPKSSEHETGLALDILTYNAQTDTFKETETYKWLHNNAHEYGFIERYQENKEYITGYSAESWHYRYVGIDLAKKVKEEGITYEEYYAFYIDNE